MDKRQAPLSRIKQNLAIIVIQRLTIFGKLKQNKPELIMLNWKRPKLARWLPKSLICIDGTECKNCQEFQVEL